MFHFYLPITICLRGLLGNKGIGRVRAAGRVAMFSTSRLTVAMGRGGRLDHRGSGTMDDELGIGLSSLWLTDLRRGSS